MLKEDFRVYIILDSEAADTQVPFRLIKFINYTMTFTVNYRSHICTMLNEKTTQIKNTRQMFSVHHNYIQ